MIPLQSFKQLLRDMRHQKLRTLMTMFGILWGTASIVLLMGFGTGIHKHQMRQFKGLGENISIVWGGMTSLPWEGLPRGRQIRFTEDDVARIKTSVPGIKEISPEYTRWGANIKYGRNIVNTPVKGVWPTFSDMRNIIPQLGGRYLNAFDQAQKRRVIVIGNVLAERLFGTADPVGQTVLVNNIPFVVVGVMAAKDQDSSYHGRDSRMAWIPTSTFRTMWTYRYPSIMIVQTEKLDEMAGVVNGIFEFMAHKYAFDPDDSEALSIWDTTETFAFFNLFFIALQSFLIGVGCLTLITGGIGVTNIMNVVLEERTKEIGIKMALGAKKRTIMLQFLFETIIMTAIGGVLGFLIALAIISVFPASFEEYVGIPTVDGVGAALAIAILGLVALVSGFFPARRAAELEPVKALKLF